MLLFYEHYISAIGVGVLMGLLLGAVDGWEQDLFWLDRVARSATYAVLYSAAGFAAGVIILGGLYVATT